MLGYRYGIFVAAGLFFMLVAVVLLSPVTIRGSIRRLGNDDHAELTIHAVLGLIRFRWELPMISLKGPELKLKREVTAENLGGGQRDNSNPKIDSHAVMQSINWLRSLLGQTNNLLGWAKYCLCHVKLKQFSWNTAVGTGDAMWTAMATGMIWSVKTAALGVGSQLIRLQTEPYMTVEPDYQKASFATEASFKATIGFGFAIFAGLNLMYRLKKISGLKRGIIGWQRILLKA